MKGGRLRQPPKCPSTIYKILLECWKSDPHHRKTPQAIMRDINTLKLCELPNSRRQHPYATLFPKPFSDCSSVYTENTIISQQEDLDDSDFMSNMGKMSFRDLDVSKLNIVVTLDRYCLVYSML